MITKRGTFQEETGIRKNFGRFLNGIKRDFLIANRVKGFFNRDKYEKTGQGSILLIFLIPSNIGGGHMARGQKKCSSTQNWHGPKTSCEAELDFL